jgi:amidohydrolase
LQLPQSIRDEIKKKVISTKSRIVETRREIHQHPERSKREEKTADFVTGRLETLGLKVIRGVKAFSVAATLKGKGQGKTVALRADMDALKLQEQTGLPFASEAEGVMHACGHDAHTAILLGAAEILSKMQDKIPGSIKFFFQPSEEAFPGGAPFMIEEGVMENPKVDACLALHLDSTLPTGKISVIEGPAIGGVTAVNIAVRGPGGHFSRPSETVDTVVVAAHVLVALQSMVAREVDYWEPFVLTFGQIIGGTRDNIIPAEVILRGDMASVNDTMRHAIEKKIESVVKGVTSGFGALYEIKFWRGYPTLVNDASMVELVKEVAAGIAGRDKVLKAAPSLVGEDFAFFAQKVPSAFWFLGAWDTQKYSTPTHHHDPKFDPDESCLPLGVELMTNMALEYLYRNK